jgi:DNA invertase Pin-like site-specific DNA recombinase
MAEGNFVAYYRVSTERQGKSGLGLEAQQKSVEAYLNGGNWKLVASFVEIESGKVINRPKLQEALAACRIHNATLVISKLDRLTRDAHFLLGLQKANVRFVAVDMPHADNFTVGILAMVAQKERELISQRTKDALAAAKARGVKLGGDRGNLSIVSCAGRAASEALRSAKATERAKDLAPLIKAEMSSGKSLRAIAKTLDAKGIKTAKGSTWTAMAISRVIQRLEVNAGSL